MNVLHSEDQATQCCLFFSPFFLLLLQEVQRCIEEQRASMKEVLEDTRLVSLQREGGAVLARMRREDLRFPQSEDFRCYERCCTLCELYINKLASLPEVHWDEF